MNRRSDAPEVARLLSDGLTPAQITRRLGVNRQYVYRVRGTLSPAPIERVSLERTLALGRLERAYERFTLCAGVTTYGALERARTEYDDVLQSEKNTRWRQ